MICLNDTQTKDRDNMTRLDGQIKVLYQEVGNMVMKVLDFDCTEVDSDDDDELGIYRPDFLNTKKHLLRNIDLLI